MAKQQESGKEFEDKVAKKLKEMQFVELSKERWPDCKNKHKRCFTKQFPSGHGLYNRSRRVDFRVRSGCREFDVEAKFQETSGTADQLAWVALKVAERNKIPLYLVIGGKVMEEECLDELEKTAKSPCYDHLRVGTLEVFAATLDEFAESLRSSELKLCVKEP